MVSDEQARLVMVLVRARNPSNIGAVARAMHDFGYATLRVVNEFPVPFEAAKSAVDASSVLASAQSYPELAGAVSDCTMVVGTTAVGERVLEHPLHLLPEAAKLIRSALSASAQSKVALLFGSEKTGLSNDELSHCHALVTIPMNAAGGRHLSLNLGQAAAVCLYEIARAEMLAPVPAGTETHAGSGEIERLTTLLRELLEASGYARRHPANARETAVRRLVRRLSFTAADASVWTGMLRQFLHAAARGTQPPDADIN